MTGDPFYKDHWINIDRDRLDRYQRMFQWSSASSVLYEPADIGSGHVVGDFGSGPGHTAIEIAKWVGVDGHVHALDINSDFVSQIRDNAKAADVSDRVTAHQCDGSALPLADGALDRLTTRNTLIYVDDVEHTIEEFRRDGDDRGFSASQPHIHARYCNVCAATRNGGTALKHYRCARKIGRAHV